MNDTFATTSSTSGRVSGTRGDTKSCRAEPRLSVCVLAFEGMHPFFLTLPLRIFREARKVAVDTCVEVSLFALAPGRIELDAVEALTLEVRQGVELLQCADVVIIPSWRGVDADASEELLGAIRAAHARGAWIVGLCMGVFVLAQAGLVDGKTAAVIPVLSGDFSSRFPLVELNRDVFYLREDRVVTSAGNVAAMDCCLAIVEEWCGLEVAEQIANNLMISSSSPYGKQAPAAGIRPQVSETDKRVLTLMHWIKSHPGQTHRVAELAKRVNMNVRTFARRFGNLTGMTPKQWLLKEQLASARSLLQGTHGIEVIAAKTGFESAAALRKQFKLAFGVAPGECRRTLMALD